MNGAGEVIGNAVPAVRFVDDAGRARSVGELAGAPTILAPIYTRCQGACPRIAASLKSAIVRSSAPTGSYHVVLFSFDARDTPESLRQFREREHLPFQWTMAAASARDSDALTQSIGFRYAAADGQFAHPNLVAVLDRHLKVAKLLGGETYTASQIDEALRVAEGGGDWRGNLEMPAFCVALLLLTLSTGYLLDLIRRARERSSPAFGLATRRNRR